MCGRFGASYRDIKTVWNLHGDFSFQTRYNIAPSQEVPVIIRNDGHNEAKLMQWGLVPSWAPETNRIRLADRAKPKCWIMPTISAGRTPLTKMKALGRGSVSESSRYDHEGEEPGQQSGPHRRSDLRGTKCEARQFRASH
jgi:hypothetical protein